MRNSLPGGESLLFITEGLLQGGGAGLDLNLMSMGASCFIPGYSGGAGNKLNTLVQN